MASAPPEGPTHVVLYDGTCGFCSRTVQWILAHDAQGLFHFAALQGTTADALRARHPEIPTDLDSVLYVDRSDGREQVYWRSEAMVHVCARLGGRWARLGALGRLPWGLADVAYRVVARNRRHLSSALGTCPLPPADARARFLP